MPLPFAGTPNRSHDREMGGGLLISVHAAERPQGDRAVGDPMRSAGSRSGDRALAGRGLIVTDRQPPSRVIALPSATRRYHLAPNRLRSWPAASPGLASPA